MNLPALSTVRAAFSGPRGRLILVSLVAKLGLLAYLFVAHAAAQAAPEAAFQSAFQHFIAASSGDTAAIEPAADEFAALARAEPANPVLMAYAGASTALRAKATMLPWKKMGHAEDGLAQIDKALALLTPAHDAPMQRGTPGSLEVRYVAANTYLAMPAMMNRGARGTKLLGDVLASPLFATAPLPFQGTVWMRAANLALTEQRKDDARRYLNDVISRHAPQAEQARALLKEAA